MQQKNGKTQKSAFSFYFSLRSLSSNSFILVVIFDKFARRGGLLRPMLSNGEFVDNPVSIFLVEIEFNDDFFFFKSIVEVFLNFLFHS